MAGYSDATIWLVIMALGIGTYLIRWSFLGAVGDRAVPDWAQRVRDALLGQLGQD